MKINTLMMNQVKPIDDLVTDLQSIGVSNDDEPNSSSIASFEDETKLNPPTKIKSSTIINQQAKKMINSSNKTIYTAPFKHNLIHPKLPDSKKLKPSMNKSCKRPGNSIFPDNNKKYKISLDNIEPSKGCLTEASPSLTYRQAISRSYKGQWIETMNSELQNFCDNKTMTFVKKLPNSIKPSTTKWVCTIKKDENGNILKH